MTNNRIHILLKVLFFAENSEWTLISASYPREEITQDKIEQLIRDAIIANDGDIFWIETSVPKKAAKHMMEELMEYTWTDTPHVGNGFGIANDSKDVDGSKEYKEGELEEILLDFTFAYTTIK